MIRRTLVTLAASTIAVGGLAAPAQASGWVANSCAVKQSLHATMSGKHPETGDGRVVKFIPCGQGASGVEYVTAGPRPYFVDPSGPQAPFCRQAGERYYPTSNGAVITPTVRCQ